MYIASGLTTNDTVINLAIGFYPRETKENYISFLTELYTTYKDYFQKNNPAIISDGDKGIKQAMKKALPSLIHFNCTRNLSERAKKISFSGPDRHTLKKRFLALFHRLLYLTDHDEINQTHRELVWMLRSVSDGSSDLAKYIRNKLRFCYALSEYPRYNQLTSNPVETLNKELLKIRESDPWAIIPEFDRLTRLQIEREKNSYYLGKYSGVFMNDDVALSPGLVHNLTYSFLHLRDFECIQIPDYPETYAVVHRDDSLFAYLLKILPNMRPCDFPGLYTSLHKPFSTGCTPTRRRRVNDAYSRKAYRVDLVNKTCSCNYFQQLERPCIHAMKVIFDKGYKVSDFCHERYQLEYAKKVFKRHQEFGDSPPFKISELLQVKPLVDKLCFGLGRGLGDTEAPRRGRPKKQTRLRSCWSPMRVVNNARVTLNQQARQRLLMNQIASANSRSTS